MSNHFRDTTLANAENYGQMLLDLGHTKEKAQEKLDKIIKPIRTANHNGQLTKEQGEEIAALFEKGKAADAASRYAEALTAFQNALGMIDKENNAEAWSSMAHNVAKMQRKLAKWDQAEPLLREALDIVEELHGKEDPLTANLLSSLGGVAQRHQSSCRSRAPLPPCPCH